MPTCTNRSTTNAAPNASPAPGTSPGPSARVGPPAPRARRDARPPRIVLAGVLGASLALGACADLDRLESWRDQAASVEPRLDARRESLERDLASLPADDPRRADLARELEQANASLESLRAAIAQADQSIAVARQGSGDKLGLVGSTISSITGPLAAIVPGPWQAPLILAGAALAALARARQLKVGLRSVAKGLEIAMREDAQFKERFKANAGTFRVVQTHAAKRVVDEVTHAKALRLPI